MFGDGCERVLGWEWWWLGGVLVLLIGLMGVVACSY